MKYKQYPRYHLSHETDAGAVTYHTKRKKAFLCRLNGLIEIRTLKNFSFCVEYYKGGFNCSIKYSPNEIETAKKVASIFVDKSEIVANKKA